MAREIGEHDEVAIPPLSGLLRQTFGRLGLML